MSAGTLTITLRVPPLEAHSSRITFLQHVLQTAIQQIASTPEEKMDGEVIGVDAAGNSHAPLGEWEFT
jgi:hypothetical protein